MKPGDSSGASQPKPVGAHICLFLIRAGIFMPRPSESAWSMQPRGVQDV